MTDDVWYFLVHAKGERILKSFDLVDYFGLDPLSDQALLTTIKSALKTPDVGILNSFSVHRNGLIQLKLNRYNHVRHVCSHLFTWMKGNGFTSLSDLSALEVRSFFESVFWIDDDRLQGARHAPNYVGHMEQACESTIIKSH